MAKKGRPVKNRVWMEVTRDQYQLPIHVADTCAELSKITGATEDAIRGSIQNYNDGRISTPRFFAVDMDEEGE